MVPINLLNLVRRVRRSAKTEPVPVFVVEDDDSDKDHKIEAAKADGTIGPQTIVVEIRKFGAPGELAARP
jgi:hypothetical protein